MNYFYLNYLTLNLIFKYKYFKANFKVKHYPLTVNSLLEFRNQKTRKNQYKNQYNVNRKKIRQNQ